MEFHGGPSTSFKVVVSTVEAYRSGGSSTLVLGECKLLATLKGAQGVGIKLAWRFIEVEELGRAEDGFERGVVTFGMGLGELEVRLEFVFTDGTPEGAVGEVANGADLLIGVSWVFGE